MNKVLKLIISIFIWDLIETEEIQEHLDLEEDVGPEDEICWRS